jgi:hypothetical protein
MLLAVFLAGCSKPAWSASETAAVELSCMTGAAQATGASITELREELGPLCRGLAEELEVEGCSPDEAADIALAVALVSREAYDAMIEC